MKSLNKTEAPICNVFFVSKGNLFFFFFFFFVVVVVVVFVLLLFYYTAAGVNAMWRP